VIVTIVVAVARCLDAPELAAFIAGAGSSAVIAYVTVANRLIRDARRATERSDR
jgi:hypothetical protein